MIDITLVVLLNNIICVLVTLSCFLHALHSGIYTNNLTKLSLYFLGIGYLGSIVDVKQVVLPGYLAIMFANVVVGLVIITVFLFEAHRAGYLMQWYHTVSHPYDSLKRLYEFVKQLFRVGEGSHVRSKK